MQKERLVIKNFGPIKSIDLELGKMTILIGEQATGKSTIAKVLAVCRYFSYIANTELNLDYTSNFFIKGLESWGIDGFIQIDSYIQYVCFDYELEVKNKLEKVAISHNEDNTLNYEEFDIFSPILIPKSDNFKTLLLNLKSTISDIKSKGVFDDFLGEVIWKIPSDFYENEVSGVMKNPFYIPTERGLQSIFSLGKNSIQNISDSLFNHFAKMDTFVRTFKKGTEIKPLNILYKNVNGQGFIKNERQTEFSSLYNGASGYQSIIPLVLAIKYYSENHRKKKTFIVEEPELNLFPKAQKKLMEFFVESINNNGHSFLLPTHSPYILSTLGNLIYAHKMGNLNNRKYTFEVNENIPEKYWIDINDLSVYYLDNGHAKNLINIEECLINLDDLDSVSEIVNKEFDELLNLEVQFENIDL